MELTFAPFEDQRGDRFGVVPPDLLGNGAKELEGGDHAMEDRFGALARQGDHEGSVRVGPGGDEEGDLPPTVGEVDVNVTEVGLEALAGEMPQGDEGLTVRAVVLAEIAPHLAVTAVVSVLVTEAAKDLRCGMPLLGGSILVVGQDLVDDGLKRPQHGRVSISGLRTGLRMLEDIPDRVPRVIKVESDPPDGLAIATRPPNGTVVVHRKHVLDLREGESSVERTFTLPEAVTVGQS